MNLIDILIGIPLLWFGYKGFTKGIISEVLSLVALVAGIWLAVHFSWFIGGYIERSLEIKDQYVSLVSFTITFLGVVVLMNFTGRIATKLVSKMALGFFNKLAGAIFGCLKAAFIISIVLYLYGSVDSGMKIIPGEMRNESVLFTPVEKIAPAIIPKLRSEKERLNDVFRSQPEP